MVIKNFLILFKRLAKLLLYRPHGVSMGRDSFMLRPHWLHNPERIFIGERCFIGRFAIFQPLNVIENNNIQNVINIGNDVYIGGYAQIHCINTLDIGDGSVLSEHVYVSDVAHGLDPNRGLIMEQPLESKGPVHIGCNVFIGYGAAILPGVSLGNHCIVGARSVVTRSFPAYSMVAGIPAKLIKTWDAKVNKWIPTRGQPS